MIRLLMLAFALSLAFLAGCTGAQGARVAYPAPPVVDPVAGTRAARAVVCSIPLDLPPSTPSEVVVVAVTARAVLCGPVFDAVIAAAQAASGAAPAAPATSGGAAPVAAVVVVTAGDAGTATP